MTGTDRIKTAASASAGHTRRDYSLTRRVLAILLGVDLSSGPPTQKAVADTSHSSRPGTFTLHTSSSLTLRVSDEVNEYDYFFKLVKSYVAAAASDRIQSRLYALASLRNLDVLIRAAAAENSFRELSSTFLRFAITFRATNSSTRVEISYCWARARSCQHYFETTHQRTLREAVAQVYDFAIEYANNRTRLLARTERLTQLEWYMQLLKELQLSNAPDNRSCNWKNISLAYDDPHIYDRGSALELIKQIDTKPTSPPEKKLEEARNALAVASHDFVGADLRWANLDDVPLTGIRWSRKTTRWPRSWLNRLLSLSTEVEPNILRIDDCNLSS